MSRRGGKRVSVLIVRNLAAKGLTDREIAAKLEVHRLVIFYFRHRHGVAYGRRQRAPLAETRLPPAERKARRRAAHFARKLDGMCFADEPRAATDRGSAFMPPAPAYHSECGSSLAWAS